MRGDWGRREEAIPQRQRVRFPARLCVVWRATDSRLACPYSFIFVLIRQKEEEEIRCAAARAPLAAVPVTQQQQEVQCQRVHPRASWPAQRYIILSLWINSRVQQQDRTR